MSALEEHLVAAGEQGGDFRVTSDEGAQWALRKVAQKRRLIAENKDLAEREIERVTRWLADVNDKLEDDAGYLEQMLADFHAQQLADDPSRKTIKLPAGTLKARKAPDKVDWTDEDAFVAWAEKEHPELVRVKKSGDKTGVKALIKETGEIIPGVAFERGEVTYKVDVEGGE